MSEPRPIDDLLAARVRRSLKVQRKTVAICEDSLAQARALPPTPETEQLIAEVLAQANEAKGQVEAHERLLAGGLICDVTVVER